MTGTTARPHPTDPAFLEAYSSAWSSDLDRLLDFFAPDGVYTDVAMGGVYEGHDGIARFFRFMLRFAPDSWVRFDDATAHAGSLLAEWTWGGTVSGPLRLRDGTLVDAGDVAFSVSGVAVCRYGDDGRLTSHRDFWDLATVLHQIGVPIGAAAGGRGTG